MPPAAVPKASTCTLQTESINTDLLQEGEMVLIHCLYIDFRSATRGIKRQHLKKIKGENFQGKPPRIVSPVSPVKLYCSYIMNVVLTVAVILSTAWSQSGTVYISVRKEKLVNKSLRPCYADCPRHWIGFESKCFYFSGDMGNWTFSQTYCMAQEAQLALFESLEELDFLKRYKGDYDHWIGLHRESTQHPWRWTDNTEYNNLVPIRGEGGYAYLSDKVISSGRVYMNRKWICSKPIAILYNDFKTWVGNVSTHA